MKLKSFGCSFIWGSELPDERPGPGLPNSQHSNLTWPALVAAALGHEYQCRAWGGTGNFSIAHQVLNELERDRGQPCWYVINWTWIDRFDYVDPQYHTAWRTLRPNEHSELHEQYYKNIHTEMQDKLMSLSQINLCIDQLQKLRVPYISTYMDHLLFEKKQHNTAGAYFMQKNIQPYMTDFEGQNFVQWALALGHPITRAGHLLETGHAAVAENILYRLGVNEIKTACA